MRNKKLRIFTYLGVLFMTVSVSFPAYINSSFLKTFVGERGVGFIYGVGAIFTILLIFFIHQILCRFGNLKAITLLSLISIASIAGLLFIKDIPLILLFFVIYYALGFIIRYFLDIYLENISEDENTGLIRGLYLTFYNTAWLISPFLSGLLVARGGYWLVYSLAGLALFPLIFITSFFLKENPRTKTRKNGQNIWVTLKALCREKKSKTKNLYNVLVVDFLLNFFYAVMVVYLPLYLHDHLGLSWQEIGLAFTVMLLPFVLFELPLGKIADKWLGEREMLIIGLLLTGGTTIMIPFLTLPNWPVWAFILFLNRTGAATIEVMKEVYLFKKITGEDTHIISLSRTSYPLSYLVGPIFASLILLFFDFKYIFLGLGLVMLYGMKYAWRLSDTN